MDISLKRSVLTPRPARDKDRDPVIFLLGDMVRYTSAHHCGYGLFAAELLQDECGVYMPPEDCGSAQMTLRNLYYWSRMFASCHRHDVDVVHWNCGLWDIERIMDDEPITPIEDYKSQLRRIYWRIREIFPNAVVVFATTTPVFEPDQRGVLRYFNRDVQAYNQAARQVLEPVGAVIDDLYAAAEDFDGRTMYASATHFSPQGAEALAQAVADCIRNVFAHHEEYLKMQAEAAKREYIAACRRENIPCEVE